MVSCKALGCFTAVASLKGRPQRSWLGFFQQRFFGLTPASWLLIGIAALAIWLLNHSSFGRRLLLVGSNPRVARLSGIAVQRTRLLAYILSGFCAALAGILLVGFSRHATLNMGASLLLSSIAAVLVGGTVASGVRPHLARWSALQETHLASGANSKNSR
ncbi:hypothetical protein EOA27_33575 [Mesorhizobium sp. M2A.F.Ca.ET.037.01.1.1]|uniref:ABC transporter permease n=1 Tax=Mesorhizobium sp. TaxID=1871066 RepID=UPI000F753045|nr:hypothetical protein EJ069_15955 [Mesorhizobium sp. M2A.F.Ca.ET.043.05.1.1]RUX01189.1 hypothetical protein EOA27_33575 [Mesorhizobium sp. M2A.F.Ca.ET.037.01.1.1]RUY11081.1 hypothetical protein EOA25_06950 [Mesorhizobium sp. M2A.F.Ca.ET.040.01.1.1]RWA89244.1 MAG: hypothetical protein EOQ31_18665 [Mesorhizobium sp.]TIV14106.1 MAG: hypothetical protein E5V95_31625 [Mesorhizobium sp.]